MLTRNKHVEYIYGQVLKNTSLLDLSSEKRKQHVRSIQKKDRSSIYGALLQIVGESAETNAEGVSERCRYSLRLLETQSKDPKA